ncbi:MAG: class I SAM-dependent methyltransferase [Anaerolineales bacterium]
MTDHRLVYEQQADRYQQLISREDYQGNLLPALEQILSLDGLDVLDLGAGTGRLTHLLSPLVNSVHAFDLSPHMLAVAAGHLQYQGYQNCLVSAADHRWIPRASNSADLIVSGWSVCYLVVWAEDNWEKDLDLALQEMRRLLRAGGTTIIIETLGTGTDKPDAPEKLRDYLSYLERAGFQQSWIRTDYKFQNRVEAADLVEFFFGQEMLEGLIPGEKPVLPECTGIWHLTTD